MEDGATEPVDARLIEEVKANAERSQRSKELAQPTGQRRRPRKRVASDAAAPIATGQAMHSTNDDRVVVDLTKDEDGQNSGRSVGETEPPEIPPNVERDPLRSEAARTSSYWEPRSRLGGRVSLSAPGPTNTPRRDRGVMIAVAVLLICALIAIGLYLVATVAIGNSDDGADARPRVEQETP